jgi:hypothetical protein
MTLTNSLNYEDRKILNNAAESIASLHMEEDGESPEIKIVNVNLGDNNNGDLRDEIQDTDGTFVAEDSEDE